MIPKQNLIYITGTNSFLVDREKQGLVTAFREKYGGENIATGILDDAEAYTLYAAQLQNPGLFASKRLFLYTGGRGKGSEKAGFEAILAGMLPVLGSDDFLIFSHISPHETELISWLKSHASVRIRNLSWKACDWEKYTTLSDQAIQEVLRHYQAQESLREKGDTNPFLGHAIYGTLTSLAILEKQGHIRKEDIREFSHAYEGGKVFDLVDYILAKNIPQSLSLLKTITHGMNTKESLIFTSSLIGILRQSLYVIALRDQGKSISEISHILGRIHPYVVQKNYASRLSHAEIGALYEKLITSSIAYKSGKRLQKSELGRILDIEIALLELKK